jgi:hypothetical protein
MVGNGAGTRKGRVQPQYSVEAGSAKTWGVLVLCVLFGSWSLRWQQRVRRTHYHLLAWEDRVCAYSAQGLRLTWPPKYLLVKLLAICQTGESGGFRC